MLDIRDHPQKFFAGGPLAFAKEKNRGPKSPSLGVHIMRREMCGTELILVPRESSDPRMESDPRWGPFADRYEWGYGGLL